MAKGIGLFGNFRKKIGNTVGYTLKNSNNAQTQGVRVYQPVVSNPKSDAQSSQRMKLMPLQIFYQAFSDVLNHAFEGRKVGQMNRQRFMQLNMTATSGQAPAVQKGERILVPLKAQVSSGALTVDSALTAIGTDQLRANSLKYDDGSYNNEISQLTLSAFSSGVIENNLGIEDGMEIAFIFIVSKESEPRRGVALKFNIVLNTADNITTIDDLMKSVNNTVTVMSDSQGYLLLESAIEGISLLGAAIIVSKRNASGWSNNNARFYPTAYGEELFYSEPLYLAALATYGPNGTTLTSDLFLRQADNDPGATDPNAVVGTEAAAIVLTGDYEDYTLSSANATLANLRSGYKAVVVDARGVIVDANGTPITATNADAPGSLAVLVKPEMTTFAGMRTVLYGSF